MFKKTWLVALCLSAGRLVGQTADVAYFRAIMLPSNEVPAVSSEAAGAATVTAHVVRSASGEIISGTVQFDVAFRMPADATVTGLHIHRGAAGVNGPVTIDSSVSGTRPVNVTAGRSNIVRNADIFTDGGASLDTLRGMFQNPQDYYINLHTSTNPGGLFRGQLQRAEVTVGMATLSPANEVPPVDLNASGLAWVIAIGARDSAGRVTSAEVTFGANFKLPNGTTLTGFHIHSGDAGVNGPVVLNSALANMPTPTGWDGIALNKVQFPLDVAADNAAAITAMNALYGDPGNHYLNIHTTEFPGGAMRGQVQKATITRLRTTAMPSNAVPPVRGLDAMAPALMDIATMRNADQTIGGALAFLAVNARFPGWVEIMDINTRVGAAGTNGPWNLLLGYSFTADNAALFRTGFANIVDLGAYNDSFSLGTIRDLLANPESQYLLIRTPDYGDTLRGQWSLSR